MCRQAASLIKILQFLLEAGGSQDQGREGFYRPESTVSVIVTPLKKMP